MFPFTCYGYTDDDFDLKREERRRKYKVKFVEPEQIPTWYEYYNENRRSLKKQLAAEYTKKLPAEIVGVIPELAKKVSVWHGNITELEIDAIVTSSNMLLAGVFGVDKAVHEAAGPELQQECNLLNGCKRGEAKVTNGYLLPASYVIHTVGPLGEGKEVLESCYRKCLKLALGKNFRTIAFPCISTGLRVFPRVPAALVAIMNTRKFLEKHANSVDRIIFCVFLPEDFVIYTNLMQIFFPID